MFYESLWTFCEIQLQAKDFILSYFYLFYFQITIHQQKYHNTKVAVNRWYIMSLWLFQNKKGVTLSQSVIACLSSTAPITAFKKRDKQEKNDAAQERVPQGQQWFV